ncbi:MAG: glycoside hydrolase family 95-like protein, partial [Flavitalea sp.]
APVQKYFDEPYDHEAAPSKIPGGALEFDIQNWGKVASVHLSIKEALCEVQWLSGQKLKTYVHAMEPVGWFRFENVASDFVPDIIAPQYEGAVKISGDPVGGDDLTRLGYRQGSITKQQNNITYRQQGWNGFAYEINVRWKRNGSTVEGAWSISSNYKNEFDPVKPKAVKPVAASVTSLALNKGNGFYLASHKKWWKNFWAKSAVAIPDSVIEKQWYLEQYKFGSSARKGAPPVSLQAVWTADNGRLPPWKGDFHHDLNTQLSYWPAYSGNHLEEALGYLDHLDQNKANYKRYTSMFFGVDGIAVPGVTTLNGTEMGGWIQYSLSPTVSSWLAQHYYLQWRYSMDKNFLRNRAYPWFKEVASMLEKITVKDSLGHRKLPISASPEINDNSLAAWFDQNTNYDLALMRFTFAVAAELAKELGIATDAAHWESVLNEFGDFALTGNNELMFAPSLAYNESHRHFSNAMAIHPLGLIKWEDGPHAQSIITNTIRRFDAVGPDYWCGYSYSWLANLKARAKDGNGAAKALQIFANAFCSVNSFHLNGDQTKSGYSKFQYRPFTLEGNFAFAAGLQEMLLQSYAGFIEIMPAIPEAWKDVSFYHLRAEGALLVDAKKIKGKLTEVDIIAEKGGTFHVKLLSKDWNIIAASGTDVSEDANGMLVIKSKPGATLALKSK